MLLPNYRPLEITLAKRGMNRTDLRREVGISTATAAKIAKQEYISLQVIARLCKYFDCDIEDIVTFTNEEES